MFTKLAILAKNDLSNLQQIWSAWCNTTSTTIAPIVNCTQVQNLINNLLSTTTTTTTTTIISTLTSGPHSTLTTITQTSNSTFAQNNSTLTPNNSCDESNLFHYIFWPILAVVVAIAASVGLIFYCNKNQSSKGSSTPSTTFQASYINSENPNSTVRI